ncbi:MAG: hypothetical protein O7C66_08940, partial [Alphaproteobacteria bacterium]|nr:hypothetical protein [Alphaproteobacteria bacterium]
MSAAENTTTESKDRFLLNPYTDWTEAQGIPVYEGFGVDMLACETKPWGFTEANGALIHLKGRGDYISVFLHDLPPGGKTRPMQHCFEEVFYVLEGHGSTRVTLTDGTEHTFEWGPKALFSVPLNTPYQLFNGSGQEVAKLSSTTNLPMVLKLFHNDEFVFNNPFRFTDREGLSEFYQGEGELTPRSPGRHTWETNFIADLQQFELKEWEARGKGCSNMMIIMADGTMHAHASEMPVGTYKKGHRHGPDFHVFCVRGEGYSVFWYEGEEEENYERFDWKHGWVFAPPEQMFHLHFNKGKEPCRYAATALGSLRYPFSDVKEAGFRGNDISFKDGGAQLEYE